MKDRNWISPTYAAQISQYKLLTKSQEIELGNKAIKGDEKAIETLVMHNLRFVLQVAKKYSNFGMEFEDLVSEGNQGLLKAAQRFDPARGVKFSTYAAWWIKQTICKALAKQSRTIRLPTHMVEKSLRVKKARHELDVELGRDPTDEELSEASHVSLRNVKRIKLGSPTMVSLDDMMGSKSEQSGEGGLSVSETIEDTQAVNPAAEFNQASLYEDLHESLGMLPHREREILYRRFGLNGHEEATLESIGREFGVTREWIRQLERDAIRSLRHLLKGRDCDSEIAWFLANPIDMAQAMPGSQLPSLKSIRLFSSNVSEALTEIANIIRFPAHLNRYYSRPQVALMP